MLLDGSFIEETILILDSLKLTRRAMVRDGTVKVNEKLFQFILSAATIPTSGKLSIKSTLSKLFPLARIIRNENFHQQHPLIDQKYIKNDAKADSDERFSLIYEILTNLDSAGSTMIFFNTAILASKACENLQSRGIECIQFHNKMSYSEKMQNFEMFRNQLSKILICTDSAARGLDFPHVAHVIQGEFALNVVQHIHRIGRASRGGKQGKATNIFDSSSSELVESILGFESENALESSFSRRRAFRRRLKRSDEKKSSDSSNAAPLSEL